MWSLSYIRNTLWEIYIYKGKYPNLEPYHALQRAFSDYAYKAITEGNKVLPSSGYCIYAPDIIGGIQRANGDDKELVLFGSMHIVIMSL